MSIPKNKSELIAAIEETYEKLQEELSTIPPAMAKRKELDGHSKNSKMSVNDLLAYLIGWGQLVLKWNERISKGLKVNFPETGFKWNELGQLAQKFYKDFEEVEFKTLCLKLEKTTTKILTLIEGKTNKELYELYHSYFILRKRMVYPGGISVNFHRKLISERYKLV